MHPRRPPQKIESWNDDYLKKNVTECIAPSYYDGHWQKHPFEEETKPKYNAWDPEKKYSWVKAPRFDGKPMQVGPLAQVLVGFVQGHEPTVRWATRCLELAGKLAGANLGPEILHSTIGRHAARAIRTAVLSELALKHWKLLAENIGKGDVAIFNEPKFPKGTVQGFGFHEAPRGVLSHWPRRTARRARPRRALGSVDAVSTWQVIRIGAACGFDGGINQIHSRRRKRSTLLRCAVCGCHVGTSRHTRP